MSLGGAVAGPRRMRLAVRAPALSADAWVAGGIAAAFILLTLWWLTQDRALPYGDAAEELWAAFRFRDFLLHGDVGGMFGYPAFYPFYGLLLGGAIATVGGISRNAVVLGANLVCVPLLALSCFQLGRRVAGSRAGVLAVAFALGSPLLTEQFHVFIIDAPEAMIVALSVWAILASERFGRIGVALLAGLAVGIGTGTKEQFPFYVAGLVAVVVARGGWRNVRGLAAFAVVAVLVGSPWYIRHLHQLHAVWSAAGTGQGLLFPVPPLARPPLVSSANVAWYGWAVLNGLLFAPLAAYAAIGVAAALVRLRDRAARRSVLPELLGGLGGGWLLLTLLTHKDMRYTLPLIAYLAVLGTAWIVRLPALPRRLATAGLAVAVGATTLGMTFGVGGAIPDRLPGNLGTALGVGVPPRDRVVVYANHDYLVSGPRRDGDMLAFFAGLRRMGIREVYWDPGAAGPEHGEFNGAGLAVDARIAHLAVPTVIAEGAILPGYALLIYQRVPRGLRPCVRYDDGMGVFALIGRGEAAVPVCPGRGAIAAPIAVPQITQTAGSASMP